MGNRSLGSLTSLDFYRNCGNFLMNGNHDYLTSGLQVVPVKSHNFVGKSNLLLNIAEVSVDS